MKFFQVIQHHGVHIRELFHDMFHGNEYLMHGIFGLLPADHTITAATLSDMPVHHRIHQFILIGKILVQCFFAHAQVDWQYHP